MSEAVDPDEADIESSRAPLLDHLMELRTRLLWSVGGFVVAFVACFFVSEQILIFLVRPFHVAAILFAEQERGASLGPFDLLLAIAGLKQVVGEGAIPLIATAPLETFIARLKLAAFGAVIVSFPLIAWQLYRFVAPGLYRREKRAFLPFLIASPVLFAIGAAMVYFVMLPFVLWFSLNQQVLGGADGISVQLMPKVSDYLSLVTTLILAFGLCFQLPVVLTLLGLSGIVNSAALAKGRRYAIVAVVVVAAFVTPPDPLSQIILALPLIALYEVSIWCVRLIERRRRDEDDAAAAEGAV